MSKKFLHEFLSIVRYMSRFHKVSYMLEEELTSPTLI